jgi:dynein heavy chain
MSKRYDSISLGQGQGKRAEEMIRNAELNGGWILLQNCHLSVSWMPELEKICEQLNENMHKDFRLWITSMPVEKFPISVLQNGVKMTLEPPKGLRANLLRTYTNLDDKELESCKKPELFKKLLFGFALFHAIIQDRRKFGPIGWNIAYEFTNEDFMVCKRQLSMLLDEYEEIPYKVINFLGAEINYGGRVTDEKDVRLIKTILATYICPEARRDKYPFSESGVYYSPVAGKQEDYLKYISELPLNPSPEAFGLHENADITNAQNETRYMLETILSVQPRSNSFEGKSREDVIEDISNDVYFS